MKNQIDHAALKAACLTRNEYKAAGLESIVSYDLARLAAQDRGLDLCVNIDIDPRPSNPGAAFLKMIDDLRVEHGHPREHQEFYLPRVLVN